MGIEGRAIKAHVEAHRAAGAFLGFPLQAFGAREPVVLAQQPQQNMGAGEWPSAK